MLNSARQHFDRGGRAAPWLGLSTHLFVKLPRPGDSEVSCHLLLLPV